MDLYNNIDIKVSVFCLCFNHEKYIRKTLEGFVNQKTNFLFEVLVHDDASTDQSRDIIQEYAERYPHLIKTIMQTENQYSKGVRIVDKFIYPRLKGKYIAICEGDDYWCDPDKLQKQFDVMESHPECSICTHSVQCCNENGTYHERRIPEVQYKIKGSRVIDEQELAECYWKRGGYPFHTSSYFYRREVVDIDLVFPRDIGILRKCLTKGVCYYLDEVMSVRRLWSIGNWNSVLRAKGIQGRYQLAIHDIRADEQYDKYTHFKYHKYIELNRFVTLMSFADFYMEEVKMLLAEFHLNPCSIRESIPFWTFLKLKIKYFAIMIFPRFYIKIKKLYKRFME